jgi:hypothetical protein
MIRWLAILLLCATQASAQSMLLGGFTVTFTPCGNISTDFSVATGCNIPVMMNLLN